MSPFRRFARQLCLALTPLALLATLAVGLGPASLGASSHREAPLISSDPDADGTDFYMFVSPDASDTVTIIATYIPFSAPEGAPNFNAFSPNVLYELNLDTVGDGQAHVKYQFEFTPVARKNNGGSFLYNNGPVTSLDDPNLLATQSFTVREVVSYGTTTTTTLKSGIPVPPPNIGSKSTPNYEALAAEALAAGTISAGGDTIRVFAGPRDDPFWVDLGSIFDLLSLRGQAPPVGYPGGPTIGVDNLTGFNSYAIAVQVPISRIFDGAPAGETVVGGWTTASRPSIRTLNGVAGVLSGDGIEQHDGPLVQVSRLGMPLVNEVVIPTALKDAFNNLTPTQDAAIYTAAGAPLGPVGDILQASVENPEIGVLLCSLYGVPLPADANDDCDSEVNLSAPASGRDDIFKIFLTGMTLTKPFTVITKGGAVTLPAGTVVNQPTKGADGNGGGIVPAEMLRLNTALKGDICSPTPSRLGVLGGDACGFPNGRRLGDDIVEIELLAVAGAAHPVLTSTSESFAFNSGLIAVLDDGVDGNDKAFLGSFPYLAPPHQGQEHLHTNLYRWILPLIAQ
jgi:hypothetical protein